MTTSTLIGREAGEFLANSATAGEQSEPKVVKLASGGFVIIWVDQSGHTDPSGRGVIGQLFDSTGAKVGGEFLVNTTTAGDQDTPSVTALSSGGFVVSWADTSSGSVALKAQIFDGSAAKSGGEFALNIGSGTQFLPQLVSLPGGGFVAVTYYGLGQAFDASGSKTGAEFTVGAFGSAAVAAPLTSGGFVVESYRFDTHVMTLQLFDGSGAKTGGEIAYTPGDFRDQPSIAALDGGAFVLTWHTFGSDVKGRVFDSAGNALGSEFLVNTTTQNEQSQPSVTGVPGGGFLVTWADTSSPTSLIQSYIKGQLFDGSGAKVGSEFTVSTQTDSPNSNHDQPSVALLDSGRFVVAWHGAGPGDPRSSGTTDGGVRAQIFDLLASATLDVTSTASTISETAPENVAAARLTTNSAAINGSYTYTLISDSTGGAFRIDGDRLVVADNDRLDFETAPTATVTIRSTDQAGDTIDKVLQLNIADSAIENRYSAGAETRVNGTTDWAQTDPAIGRLSSGGFVVAWTDGSFTADGTGSGIKALMFDSAGAPVGAEFLVNTQTSSVQSQPSVTSLAGGAFLISWTDLGVSPVRVKAQIFDPAGHKVGGEILLNTTTGGTPLASQVSALAGGGFVATWVDDSHTGADTSGTAVRLQLFDGSGNKVGGEVVANTATAGNQNQAVVAGLPGGGFVAVWTDASLQGGDASGTAVKAQLFDANGAKVGAEFLVNTATSLNQGSPSVAGLASGGFVISWEDTSHVGGDTSGTAVKAQLFAADGSKVGGEILANTTTFATQFQPSITPLATGGFAISWTNTGTSGIDTSSTSVSAQLFDASGSKVGAEFLVNDVTAFGQSQSKLAGLTGGSLAAIWLDGSRGSSSLSDIKLRLFARTDLATAHNDAFTTDEAHSVAGNLFADNGSGADTGASHVLSVNGSAAAVGQQIVLASGALLTVNSNGTFSYDPNGAFNYLVPPGGGASDLTASDGFTYTIDSGSGAAATVTVNGLASAGDEYRGTPGADLLTGTTGGDHMIGGAGDDVYVVDHPGDVVTENAGEGTDEVRTALASYILATNVEKLTGLSSAGQSLTGNGGANVITGNTGDDVLAGGAGSDSLDGGAGFDTASYAGNGAGIQVSINTSKIGTVVENGSDTDTFSNVEKVVGTAFADSFANIGPATMTLEGGGGDDVYTIGFNDTVVELANGGHDEVRTNAPVYTLAANVETLTGISLGGQTLTGNGLDNVITGNVGDDVIDGGAGADSMAGGSGNDQYYVDNVGDVVTESANAGDDRVSTTLASYTLGANLEHLFGLAATGQTLTGNALDNGILGGDGNDVIDGGAGADTLIGAGGNDIYYVDNSGDSVMEFDGVGVDEVRTMLASYTLGTNLENLTGLASTGQTLTGNGSNNVITGAGGNDIITGGGGSDTADGGAGTDGIAVDLSAAATSVVWNLATNSYSGPVGSFTNFEYFVSLTAGTGDDRITTSTQALDDLVYGGAGADIITVYSGHDAVDGGLDSDLLVIDYSAATAAVTVANFQPGSGGGAGWQGVISDGGSHGVFFDNIERLDLTTGSGDDFVSGASGDDSIRTGLGADTLLGGGGDDVLDGGAGADHMTGGAGNDIFYVDNSGDVVTENSGEGNADEVRTGLTGYVLAANVEKLTWTGAGGGDVRGNALDNILTGGTANDFIRAQDGGNDTVNLGAGDDAVYFGAAYTSADIVDGGSGKDQLALQGDYSAGVTLGVMTGVETLVAMTHSDVRFGGGSASPYSYNIVSPDSAVAAGTQLLVNASTLEAGENLTFDGSAETNGSFFIYGGKGVDTLTGGAGADVFFFAEDGRFAATDHVDGGAGADAMVLRGNYTLTLSGTSIVNVETVVLNSGSDARFYAAGTPFNYDVTTADDTVAVGQTMTFNGGQLGSAETLHFDGSAETNGNFRLFGGSANDVIKGGAGNDLIYGGLGADQLTGGAGADVIWLKGAAESSSTHYDTLIGFNTSVDRIDLPFAVSGVADNGMVGTINLATFDADIARIANQDLNPNGAIMVTTDNQSDIGGHVFLIVDADGDGAYQADHDYVFDVTHSLINPTPAMFI